jgi:hypothetical protein
VGGIARAAGAHDRARVVDVAGLGPGAAEGAQVAAGVARSGGDAVRLVCGLGCGLVGGAGQDRHHGGAGQEGEPKGSHMSSLDRVAVCSEARMPAPGQAIVKRVTTKPQQPLGRRVPTLPALDWTPLDWSRTRSSDHSRLRRLDLWGFVQTRCGELLHQTRRAVL